MKITHIYVDMDGVLIDFVGAVRRLTGVTPSDYYKGQPEPYRVKDFWKIVRRYAPDVYAVAPLMGDAMELWSGVNAIASEAGAAVSILTAVPLLQSFPNAPADKRASVDRYLGTDVIMELGPYAVDKQLRATPTSVLIDDTTRNIDH